MSAKTIAIGSFALFRRKEIVLFRVETKFSAVFRFHIVRLPISKKSFRTVGWQNYKIFSAKY